MNKKELEIFKENVVKNIKLKLGAPVINIELTPDQYELAFNNAENFYDLLTESNQITNNTFTDTFKAKWVFNYAVAESKEILGRIRGKFRTIGELPNDASLDAAALLEESVIEKQILTRLINNK